MITFDVKKTRHPVEMPVEIMRCHVHLPCPCNIKPAAADSWHSIFQKQQVTLGTF
jgi:hypothetical protein